MTTLNEAREAFERNEKALMCESVIDLLRARQRTGSLESEADFLAGAMAVINYVFPHEEGSDKLSDDIPVAWIMFPMAGRSVLDAYKDSETH